MTPEEQLIQCYFDAFNRHDTDGVMACFHEEPTLVHADGKPLAGRQEVRHSYDTEFAMSPRRALRPANVHGQRGHGVAESLARGTRARDGKVFEAIGAEVMEIVDGKIKEIRDYHQPVAAKAA
jgi:ketosteroid isomerase-like protein